MVTRVLIGSLLHIIVTGLELQRLLSNHKLLALVGTYKLALYTLTNHEGVLMQRNQTF